MDALGGVELVANDSSQRGVTAVDTRPPLEHALVLDEICSSIDAHNQVFVATDSTTLLQAVVNRHDTVLASEKLVEEAEVVVPPNAKLCSHPDSEPLPVSVDRVLVLEPSEPADVHSVIERGTAVRHDCLVGNPYSFNRIEDRALEAWCRPTHARNTYETQDYSTTLTGYHGPRSLLESVKGRIWAGMGRPDRRDQYTHRMRSAYRERRLPLALLSCLVHIRATPAQS